MIGSLVLGCVVANNIDKIKESTSNLITPIIQENDLEYRMRKWFITNEGITSTQALLNSNLLLSIVPGYTTFEDKRIKVRSKQMYYMGIYASVLSHRCYDHANAESSAQALMNMLPQQEEYEINLSYTLPFVMFRAGADIISYLPSAAQQEADYLAQLGLLALKTELGTCFIFNQRTYNV